MTLKIHSVIETGIDADSLDAAEDFYGRILGLPVIQKDPDHHLFLQVGDSDVLLVFLPDASRKGDSLPAHGATGPGHFALGIPRQDLDRWRQHLTSHGIPIEQKVDWPRGGKSLYFRDPAGNLVELVTPGIWGLPSGW